MKVFGISEGTIVTAQTGNIKVENCNQALSLVSRFDTEKSLFSTAIIPSSVIDASELYVYKLITESDRSIEVTENCKFLCSDGIFRELFNISSDANIETVDGPVKVSKIESKRKANVYSVLMQSQHSYVANGFIVSNAEQV